MKNRYILLFFCFIFFQNFSVASEFRFEVKKIQISQDNNKIIADKGRAISSDNDLEIYADSFEYKKNKKILEAFGNGKASILSKNLSISISI